MSDDTNESTDTNSDHRDLSESRDSLSGQVTGNAGEVRKSESRNGSEGPQIDDVGFGHIPSKVHEQTGESTGTDEG
jgi:hypothetical protein